MEKVNFTSGTWSVRKNAFSANPIIEANLGEFSKFVAHLPSEESEPEELEANAALIAAAPELLEALNDFVLWANIKDGSASQHLRDNALMAINKATGK